jgi:two-component system response regulator YesN
MLGFDTNIDFDYLNNLFVYPIFCLFGLNIKKIYNNNDKRLEIIKYTNSEISKEFSLYRSKKDHKFQLANIENENLYYALNFYLLIYSCNFP